MRQAVRLLLCLSLVLGCALAVLGAEPEPWIVVFYEAGCPDCAQIEELLTGLVSDLPSTAVVRYDIADPKVLDLLMELAHAYEIEVSTVPVVFVGNEVVLGAGRSQEFQLRNAVGACTVHGCESPLKRAPSLAFRSSILRLTLFVVLFALLLWCQTS